jgi:signal transduction histidine kinase
MHITICLDLIFLTFLLWIAGGAKSPIKVFYLIHVFLAALLLGPHAAYGHALFGFTLLSGLVLGQWWGWIPHLMPVGVVNSAQPINGHYVFTALVVQGTAMGVAAYLVSGLTKMLHNGEAQLSQANAELSKLSQLRRAFLHTALHDLKAPFDAITMIMYNLEAGSPDRLTEQQAKWVARCRLRLNEVSEFLRDFQTIASLDSATLAREGTRIDVAAMLHRLVVENEDLAEERMHEVFLDAPGSLPTLIGIERLIHEAAANLITNAIKYTPLGGRISIRAFSRNKFMRIEVADNGVGIAPEDQGKLFQEFVRFRHRQERTGKMPGSGLGLSIVRRIVELHGGTVGLQSKLHEGSTFFIELPLHEDTSTGEKPTTMNEGPLSTSADAR